MKIIIHINLALLILVVSGCSDRFNKFEVTIDAIKEKHGKSVQLYGESTGPFVSKSSWLLASPATPEHPEGFSSMLIWQENGSAKEKEFSPIPGQETRANKYEDSGGAVVIAVWNRRIEEQKPQGEAQADQGTWGKLKDSKARAYAAKVNSDLKQIALALKVYYLEAGEYPATETGLNELTEHLLINPIDPWKRDYHYKRESGGFSLWSTGPSKEDETDDIRFVPEK